MSGSPISTVEEANRHAKARRLAEQLATHLGPGTPLDLPLAELGDKAARWSDLEWAKVAHTFDERAPAAATRQLVVSLLRQRDRAARRQPADPFEGLPA